MAIDWNSELNDFLKVRESLSEAQRQKAAQANADREYQLGLEKFMLEKIDKLERLKMDMEKHPGNIARTNATTKKQLIDPEISLLKQGYSKVPSQLTPQMINELNMRSATPGGVVQVGDNVYRRNAGQGDMKDVYIVGNAGNIDKVGSVGKNAEVFKQSLTAEELGGRAAATENVRQGYFKEPEIEDLRDLSDSRNTLKEVISGLEELGIKDPSKYGTIEEETVDSNFGPISIPARFNLAAQYSKDPKYTAIKQKLERSFNKYRKVITGAQAANAELKTLRGAFASFKDRPEVFFENMRTLIGETDRMINSRFDLYDAVGRDTSKLRKLYQGEEARSFDSFSKDTNIPKDILDAISKEGKIKAIRQVK